MPYLRLRTAPTTEPVTLDQLKAQLRVTHFDEEWLIQNYLESARIWCENYCSRSFFTQTWDYYANCFPPGDEPFSPGRGQIQSVVTFVYDDTSSVQTTLTASDYQIETNRDRFRVYPAIDETWPETDGSIENVNFRFIAGWSTVAAIPRQIKQAILMLAAEWYRFREPVTSDTINAVPHAVEALLSDYVIRPYP